MYGTGNSAQCYVAAWMGEEFEGEWIQVSVQFSRSVISDSAAPWTAAHQASLSTTNSWNLLKLMSIELVMPSNHLFLCHPLILLPSIFPSIRVFSNKSVLCIRSPEYWSFTFGISPSDEYSALISFRTSWFDLLGVQGTLKSLLQHHSSNASIIQCSAFFIVQLSHPYMTTGTTIAVTRLKIPCAHLCPILCTDQIQLTLGFEVALLLSVCMHHPHM